MWKIYQLLMLLIISVRLSYCFPDNSTKSSWMLDEHTFLTKQVLDELILHDSLNNKPIFWKNSELALIVLASSVLTDIWDKGQFITTQVYSFPAVVEAALPFIKQMEKYSFNNAVIVRLLKQGALYTDFLNEYIEDKNGFNKYPEDCNDNLSRTQGFHFDNLFTYNLIFQRWDKILIWIKKQGSAFKKTKPGEVKKWFALIGSILHAIQDFYCHSNWVIIHANHNKSFDSKNIPTWEDFNDTLWRNNHSGYDTRSSELLLTKLKKSNDSIVSSEFFIDDEGNLSLNGGLQTGNCHNRFLDNNTCDLMTCISFPVPNAKKFAWVHRHPGQRLNNEANQVKILFNNFYVDFSEYRLAMQLTKRASEFWIKRMLMSDVIGFDKQQEIYSALMKDGDSTRIFEDPFTGCEIDIKTEILQKIYGVRY